MPAVALVLLRIIMGQNVQSEATDAREGADHELPAPIRPVNTQQLEISERLDGLPARGTRDRRPCSLRVARPRPPARYGGSEASGMEPFRRCTMPLPSVARSRVCRPASAMRPSWGRPRPRTVRTAGTSGLLPNVTTGHRPDELDYPALAVCPACQWAEQL
jgi:hypothetical protein